MKLLNLFTCSFFTKFLKGNTQDEVKRLKGLMYEESEKLNFEKAKEYLDIINEIDVLTEKQKMEFDIIDSDIFGYVVKENHISIQIFHIRNGKMTERSGFLFDVMNDPTEICKAIFEDYEEMDREDKAILERSLMVWGEAEEINPEKQLGA